LENRNKRKRQIQPSPDERESRLLGRDGKVAGKWFINNAQAIRF